MGEAMQSTVRSAYAAHDRTLDDLPILESISPMLGPGPGHVRPLMPAADEASFLR